MKINVIDRDGKKYEVDADPGDTLEYVVSQKGISSDWGICGGCCACSSCQVYMQEKDYAVIGAPDDTEQAVLCVILCCFGKFVKQKGGLTMIPHGRIGPPHQLFYYYILDPV